MFQTHLPLSQKSHFRKFIHKYAYTYLKYLEGHLLEDFLQKPKIVSTQVLIYGDVIKYGIAVHTIQYYKAAKKDAESPF